MEHSVSSSSTSVRQWCQLFIQAVHIMTFSDCRANLVEQLSRDGQEEMIQIDTLLSKISGYATEWCLVQCKLDYNSQNANSNNEHWHYLPVQELDETCQTVQPPKPPAVGQRV